MFIKKRYLLKFNSIKQYLLFIKQKQEIIQKDQDVSERNNGWKTGTTKERVLTYLQKFC